MAKRKAAKKSAAGKTTVQAVARGNPIAQNPLMRKGGVHEKSRSAKRQQAKRDLRKQITLFFALTKFYPLFDETQCAYQEARRGFTTAFHLCSLWRLFPAQ